MAVLRRSGASTSHRNQPPPWHAMARAAVVAAALMILGAAGLIAGIGLALGAVIAGVFVLGLIPVGLLLPSLRHQSENPPDKSFLGDVARRIERDTSTPPGPDGSGRPPHSGAPVESDP
jgi:hypothetical protein